MKNNKPHSVQFTKQTLQFIVLQHFFPTLSPELDLYDCFCSTEHVGGQDNLFYECRCRWWRWHLCNNSVFPLLRQQQPQPVQVWVLAWDWDIGDPPPSFKLLQNSKEGKDG